MFDATTWIAIYGAALSSITAGLKIYEWRHDKPTIKVKSSFGFLTYTNGEPSEPKIIFSALNKGKRPVTLSSFGIDLDTNEVMIIREDTGLPHKLMEGESHQIFLDIEKFETNLKGKHPTKIHFGDQVNNQYSCKWHLKL